MTKETQPTRVTDWENREVKGSALASKVIHEGHNDRVAELRSRQEVYQKSLPKDPTEALRAISKANCGGFDFCDDGNFGAKAALDIMLELTRVRALDEIDQDVVFWLVSQGCEAMDRAIEVSRLTNDIASQFHERHEPFSA